MKNLLSIILLTLLTGFAYAQQVNVTLSVDVTNETVDPSGVHVAGNWDPNATWNPAAFPMTQSGNMWNITIQVEANSTFEYKFLLGDDWSKGNEGLDSEAGCVVGN
ncbi:MAG TPA: carbohydrate-binding module family 20 domain-containing protein, partial [Saprospiraceae bacterium]|nr:carbohydrate-binding module family 20 domain-containing protein [Saprospiraceae bacterium]